MNANRQTRWGLLGLAWVLAAATGCQTWVAGMTLPSGHYLEHPPQYIPPSPEYPLPRELATQEETSVAPAAGRWSSCRRQFRDGHESNAGCGMRCGFFVKFFDLTAQRSVVMVPRLFGELAGIPIAAQRQAAMGWERGDRTLKTGKGKPMGKKPVLGMVSDVCVGLALTGCKGANSGSDGPPVAKDNSSLYKTQPAFGPGATANTAPSNGWSAPPTAAKSAIAQTRRR